MHVVESSGTCWMLDHVVQAMSRLWKILAFLECTYMNILFVSFWKNIGTPANPNACVPKIYCGPFAEGKSILYLLCFKRLAWDEFTDFFCAEGALHIVELSQSASAVSCTTTPRESWSSGENSVWGFPDFGSHTICHTPSSACHWCQEKQPSTTHCTRAIQCFTCFFLNRPGTGNNFSNHWHGGEGWDLKNQNQRRCCLKVFFWPCLIWTSPEICEDSSPNWFASIDQCCLSSANQDELNNQRLLSTDFSNPPAKNQLR